MEEAQTGIKQTVMDFGPKGLAIFWEEIKKLEKLEDEIEREKQIKYHDLAHLLKPDHWTSAVQFNSSPSMAEYYENEGRAMADIGYQLVESPMSSLKKFLQLIEKNVRKPTNKPIKSLFFMSLMRK